MIVRDFFSMYCNIYSTLANRTSRIVRPRVDPSCASPALSLDSAEKSLDNTPLVSRTSMIARTISDVNSG